MAEVSEIDLAEGLAASQDAPKYRETAKVAGLVDAENDATRQGLSMADMPTQDGYVDPSVVQIIYHKYDGREVVVPAYMVPKLLAMRIPDETGVPREFVNQLAWSVRPNSNYEPGELKCLLHKDQDASVLAELEAIGLTPGRCNKATIHTPYHVNIHMKLKHKDEYAALLDQREKAVAKEARDTSTAQTEALTKMAEAIAANAAPPAKK